ncbi:uncharacterized protein [Dermacentor andersoni]|uniref:uncharacterized protein n=1 Tax=Dermacentor andersoni TaxID=34620 RepID=UPI0024178F7D|nr:uncharacterized protein LOC129386991 [Dermacentor andersoni]
MTKQIGMLPVRTIVIFGKGNTRLRRKQPLGSHAMPGHDEVRSSKLDEDAVPYLGCTLLTQHRSEGASVPPVTPLSSNTTSGDVNIFMAFTSHTLVGDYFTKDTKPQRPQRSRPTSRAEAEVLYRDTMAEEHREICVQR